MRYWRVAPTTFGFTGRTRATRPVHALLGGWLLNELINAMASSTFANFFLTDFPPFGVTVTIILFSPYAVEREPPNGLRYWAAGRDAESLNDGDKTSGVENAD